ncbi:MAG: radical SAM protein [Candidatus Aegiribacteria sp.]|nr:radical SAM protein [Candidatus Aegiribacteria sp.]
MSRKPAAEHYEENRRRILGKETCNQPVSEHGIFEIILASPREYSYAMSSLAFQSVYQQLVSWPETYCERSFFPVLDEYHWRSRYNHPTITLETGKSIKECDLLVFTPSKEADYIRILQMMSLSDIKLRAENRIDKWPLVIASGISVTANPMPLSLFMDAFVIGETEPSLGPVLDTIKSLGAQGASKKKLLRRLATLPGMYIPSVHEIPGKVNSIMRQWAGSEGMGSKSCITSSECARGETIMLEISRGCPYNCKFCQLGYVSLPYRECKLEDIEESIRNLPDIDRLTILGSSPRSHPDLRKMIKTAEKLYSEVLLDSNKTEELTLLFPENTLILAPETGTDSLRKIIGKKLSNSMMFESVEKHSKNNVKGIIIHFMLGLPFETDSDRKGILDFVSEVRNRTSLPIYVSVNPFIPKPWTAFQWSAMAGSTDLREWIKELVAGIKRLKKVSIEYEEPRNAHIMALLARGDHRTSYALEEKLSGVGWNTAFKRAGISIRWVLEELDTETSFEWDFLNMGFGHTRLAREYQSSFTGHQNRIKSLEKDTEKTETAK